MLRRQSPPHIHEGIAQGVEQAMIEAQDHPQVLPPPRTASPGDPYRGLPYEDRPFDLTPGQSMKLSPGRARNYLLVQNKSEDPMFLCIGKPATDRGIEIPPKQNYEPARPPTGSISVLSLVGGSGVIAEG